MEFLKQNFGRKPSWNAEDMERALREVERGVPVLKVAEKYSIPRRTLRNYINYNGDMTNNMKFLENFDPEKSNRERRKLTRKIYGQPSESSSSTGKKYTYNDRGIHVETGLDLCDCLNKKCQGCFFPCPKCGSSKCGHECRVNRKWSYEAIEIHGTDRVIKSDI